MFSFIAKGVTTIAVCGLARTGVSSLAHQAVNHPDATAMIRKLSDNDIETIPASITDDMGAEERVSEIIDASAEATREAGLSTPFEDRMAAQEVERQATQNTASEDEMSYGFG